MRIRVQSEGAVTETTLAHLFAALGAVTRSDDEIEAVFACMLDENRIQVLPEPALAA